MTNLLCPETAEEAISPPVSTPAPARRLSLSHNFVWALGGNVTFAACQGAVLVLLAKATDPAMVGRFALALAITAPLFLLTNLQLRAVQATDALGHYRFGHYLALRLLTTVAALATLPIILLVAGYSWSFAAVAFVIGIGKSFDALNDVMYGLVQKHERLDRGGMARVTAGIATLSGLGILLWCTGSLFWAAIGWAAGHGVVTLAARGWVGDDILKQEDETSEQPRLFSPLFDWGQLGQLTLLALPMGVVMMLGSLQINAPRYFIEHYLDDKLLGIYAAIAYLMLAGHMVSLAMGQAVTPRLAKHFAAAEFSQYFAIIFRLLGIAVAGGALAFALTATLGSTVLSLLFTPEYAQHTPVLICLSVVLGIEAATSFLGEAMTATRKFKVQTPVLLAALIAAAVSCVLLIPPYGLMGAAIATGIGAFTQFIGSALVVLWAVSERRKESA
ncbi:hypothetical protein [Bremerella cremea]|uniref:lipopolysaccharide biosynthesis protein n=1 Tax=Bremerella cremea TaxID=1031537 RepID=UPI0031E6D676